MTTSQTNREYRYHSSHDPSRNHSDRNRHRCDRHGLHANGYSERFAEGDLDVKCCNLLREGTVQKFLEEDSVVLNVRSDAFPVFECFATEISSIDAKKKLYTDLRVGDELCCRIRRVELAGIYVEPLCTLHPFRRALMWISDFQVLLGRNLQNGRDYRPNDLIKVSVADVNDETNVPVFAIDEKADLLTEADLPAYFRHSQETGNRTFDEYLKDYLPATNPNLASLYGVETNSAVSFLRELKGIDFSSKCRAPYLRIKQNENLSMASAKKGVDKIREGENALAIQHFNKALSIFERNVEALVGRAAAYANMGQYNLAESDLDEALKINERHTNARNYMIETLIQGARKCEEAGKKEEAKAKYEKILSIQDDIRALKALRSLERSPSFEVVETKKVDVEAKRKEKERLKEEERRQQRKRRKDAEKLAEYERFIAKLKSK